MTFLKLYINVVMNIYLNLMKVHYATQSQIHDFTEKHK